VNTELVIERGPSENSLVASGILSESRETAFSKPQKPITLRDWRLWALSLSFFWILFVLGMLSMLTFERAGGETLMRQQIVILPAIQDTIFALLAPIVFVIAFQYPLQRPYRRKRALAYFAGGVFFTAVHVLLRILSYPAWNYAARKYEWSLVDWRTFSLVFHWPALKTLFLWNLVEDIFSIYIPVIVAAHAWLYYTRYKERELRSAQLQTQLSDAKLLALKNQLQPHFLFNTLHSISSLMLRDVRLADTMIARLSDLLRMSLEDVGEHFTSLKREIEFTQAYLDIERIRFGDRLSAKFEVPPALLDLPVPQFLLQPLVENSIKHGISKRVSGGEIAVMACRKGSKLALSVRDSGAEVSHRVGPTVQAGFGLKATRERLRTLYGEDQNLNADFFIGGAEVTILIPIPC
jgi:signal transduction histidine kinase